jgi:hypothetical protein
MGIYLKKIYMYYSEQANILMNKLERDIDELYDQVKLTLRDLLRQLNLYTDEPMNDMESSEPHSVKEYYDSKIFFIELINFKNVLSIGLIIIYNQN